MSRQIIKSLASILMILTLFSCSPFGWQSYHTQVGNQKIRVYLPEEWKLYDDDAFAAFEDSLLNQERVFGLPHILDLAGIWSLEGSDSYITLSAFSDEKRSESGFSEDYIRVHYSSDSLSGRKIFSSENRKVDIKAFYEVTDGFLHVSSLIQKQGEPVFLEFFLKSPDDNSMALISKIFSSIR